MSFSFIDFQSHLLDYFTICLILINHSIYGLIIVDKLIFMLTNECLHHFNKISSPHPAAYMVSLITNH